MLGQDTDSKLRIKWGTCDAVDYLIDFGCLN